MKFRKKPVVVEAIQFVEVSRTQRKFGESVEYNDTEIANFVGKRLRLRTEPNGNPEGRSFLEIETLEGVMSADVGDWIIKGVKGEFYPCKPDIFEATYDLVSEPDQPVKPRTEFGDPRAQQVYEIICGDIHPPAGEHWDGYVSRLIVDALLSADPVKILGRNPTTVIMDGVNPVNVPSDEEVLKIAIDSGLASRDSTGDVVCAWREDADISEYLVGNARSLLAKYSEHTRECSEHHAKCSEVTGYTAEDMASAAAQGFRDGVRAASNLIAKLEQDAGNGAPEPCQHEWSIVTAWEDKGKAKMGVVCTKCSMTGSVAL